MIKFENVTATYAKNIGIFNLTFHIPKGELIFLMGPTGAGKSTIVDLILGLHSPTSGKILVDSIDINDNMKKWQNSIGYIPQNIFMGDETIKANIAFGFDENTINYEMLNNAINYAQLREFIDSLPDELETVVGEQGVRISGGQRQRIGIARALYRNPSLIVMDEATASLDNQTEAEVMKAIQNLSGDITLIIIAHRLSTIENCDIIYYLSDGEILDSGTFNSLLSQNEKFKKFSQK